MAPLAGPYSQGGSGATPPYPVPFWAANDPPGRLATGLISDLKCELRMILATLAEFAVSLE